MNASSRWSTLSSARAGWLAVGLVLALGTLSFAVFYPSAITVRDEGVYINQARALAQGVSRLEKIDPFTGRLREFEISEYPVGTSLLMTPFVWVAGWRGAFVVPFLCFAAGVLITARWLHEEDRSPFFALAVAGFPAALVIARVSMSDGPSLAIVALGFWLFWRGLDRSRNRNRNRVGYWLAAGFAAGASLNLREGNALLFVPFFAGCLARRERAAWAPVIGGALGVGTRLLASALIYGDPLHYKEAEGTRFAIANILPNLPLHALALLVCVPGGLVAALLYRGRRRPELIASVCSFSLFYLLYWYSARESGPLKRLVLGQRYFLPLLPLLAFAMAEVVPRLWGRWIRRRSDPHASVWPRLATLVTAGWFAAVTTAAVLVHPIHGYWGRGQAAIRDAISRYVEYDSIVITNWNATAKFFDVAAGRHLPINSDRVRPEHVEFLTTNYPEVLVVLVDRSDSEFSRRYASRSDAFVEGLSRPPELLYDEQSTPTDRLRIWRLPSTPRR